MGAPGGKQFSFHQPCSNLRRPVITMSDKKASNQMWGGRFASGPAAIMEAINASIGSTRNSTPRTFAARSRIPRCWRKTGIISAADQEKIAHGLNTILTEIEAGKFEFSTKLEDIHMNVEARLAELIGPAAGRLHTARSRNDQVAVDFRLWVKDECFRVAEALKGLIAAFLERAEEHAATVMPGFTHLQSAQPVTFGHHCMAYVEMFSRDLSRVQGRHRADGRKPARRRGACRHRLSDRPAHDGQGAGLPRADAQFAGQRVRPRFRAGVPVGRGDLRHASVAAGRGDRHLVDAAIRLREAVGQLLDRLVDHAAEEEPRRRRTGAGQDRPRQRPSDRPADGDEGPAADLFQGHAGRQGSGVRRRRDARPDAGGDDRHGARHDGRTRPR